MLLAALNKKDRNHRKARKDLIEILTSSHKYPLVSDYVLDECYTYLAYRVPEKLEPFDNLVNRFIIIPVGINTFFKAKEVFKRFYPRLSFTDATTAVLAKDLGAELLTYDESLLKVFFSL
ncbi:nucleotide-binding protein [Ignicoccus pacificus DSM 13166]|uniref:Nucleotide-binding protein n=1 Tax=Ignicoccus pacificus DSM 13166 TaxID=940294 RepID=A0A977K9Y2_9CREN|nr:nucleotide-binding protein [Ignicoccus pacificus DSM 13166]